MSEKQYIEREAALSDLNDILNDPACPIFIAATVDQILSQLPAAPVREVVRGKWEKRVQILRIKRPNFPEITCSVCGEYFCDIVKRHEDFYNFCPSCGADMREIVPDIDVGCKGGAT